MTNDNVVTQAFGHPATVFKLVIENNNYDWHQQYISKAEIRKLANLPAEVEIFLAVTEPWNDQLLLDDEKINLGRPDIEHFYVKRALSLTINKEHFEWDREFITGKQIKHLRGINAKDQLFLSIKKPGEDQLIGDDEKVNLALPGVEHFYSVEVEKEIVIIVNGTPIKWDNNKITFKEIIIIAYGSYIDRPTMVYTVGYEDGPGQNLEGSMLKGDAVFVKNKMIFHATATDKS